MAMKMFGQALGDGQDRQLSMKADYISVALSPDRILSGVLALLITLTLMRALRLMMRPLKRRLTQTN